MANDSKLISTEFEELVGGNFQLVTTIRDSEGTPALTATEPMSRFEAEELMHQMVFILGYKVTT